MSRVEQVFEGAFRLTLPDEERELFEMLSAQLKALLSDEDDGADGDDAALARLFPDAYGPDDPDRSAEYTRLMRGELVDSRLASLDLLREAAGGLMLDEGQLDSCMRAVNDLRLVLGSRLGITDDWNGTDVDSLSPTDVRFPAMVLLDYLTFLQYQMLTVLTGEEPEE